MENKSAEYLKSVAKLYAALRHLGFSFEKFECSKTQRIVFQKLVYALQRSGLKFGYSYNLYINGPYSPGLATDGYFIAENIDKFEDRTLTFAFSDVGLEKIEKAKSFLLGNTSDSNWLETICTLDYLYRYSGPSKQNEEIIIDKFREIKSHIFNVETVNAAIRAIKQHASS